MTEDERKALFDAIRKVKGSGLTDDDMALINAALSPPARMSITERGLAIIREHEGLRLKAYLCPAGIPTIGYGHTKGVKMGQTITAAQADAFLLDDVQDAEAHVRRLAPTTTQGQFDALVSFTFNLGPTNLGKSTLLKKHRAGDYKGAKDEFKVWRIGGGKVLPGLVKRRAQEAEIYGS